VIESFVLLRSILGSISEGLNGQVRHDQSPAASAPSRLAGLPMRAEVVDTVLAATRAAAGPHGERWSWAREERAVRRMCADWLAKHPEIAECAETAATESASASTKASSRRASGRP
jgi:hypothetical protein